MTESKKLSLFGAGSTALTNPGQSVASKLGAAVAIMRAAGAGGGLAFPLLTCDYQDGVWVFGQERTEVEPDLLWGIDTSTIMWGSICWPDPNDRSVGRKPLGQVMVRMGVEDKPDPSTLPNHGRPWDDAYSAELVCLTGEDRETRVLFKGNSGGVQDAMLDLTSRIARQYNEDPERTNPVVLLREDHYPSRYKAGAFIYKPKFVVKGWIGPEDDLDETLARIAKGEAPVAREAIAEAPAEPLRGRGSRGGGNGAPAAAKPPAGVRIRRTPGATA